MIFNEKQPKVNFLTEKNSTYKANKGRLHNHSDKEIDLGMTQTKRGVKTQNDEVVSELRGDVEFCSSTFNRTFLRPTSVETDRKEYSRHRCERLR